MDKFKKFFYLLYIILFFAVCIAPIALFPIVKNTDELEKRELAAPPQLMRDGSINSLFADECNVYISEHFPFRSELLSISNRIINSVFKSPSANVVAGKDGWLFYEATVDDYMNTNAMTNIQLNSIVVTLGLIEEQVSDRGGQFLFVPVPNKNSVYGQYMPDSYSKGSSSNLQRLYALLEKEDVSHVNLKQELDNAISMDLSSGSNPGVTYYHKLDSHWNYLGARLGYNSIMHALSEEYSDTDHPYTPSLSWDGDLEKLLYPKWGSKDIQYHMDYPIAPYRFITPLSNEDNDVILAELMSDKEENDNIIVTKHSDPAGDSELYMVRDSFGRALLPYMINEYDTASFVRTNCPYIATLQEGCDVIYEIVERNLDNIIYTAPYMFAPLREMDTDSKVMSYSDLNVAFASDDGYAYRIYGAIDPGILGDDSRIYVKLFNDDRSYVFEAFPIFEQSLMDPVPQTDTGFSLMLDSESIKNGSYDVQVISGDNITSDLVKIYIESNESSNAENSSSVISNNHELSDYSGFQLLLEKSAIVYNNTAIHIGDDINYLEPLLGKMSAPPITIESCIAGEDALEFYYPYLTIEALEDGTIISIDVSDNGYKGNPPSTIMDITLGSAENKLKALGSDYLQKTTNPLCYTFSEGDVSVYYYFNTEGVSSISITNTGYMSTNDTAPRPSLHNGEFVMGDYTHNRYGWRKNDNSYEYYDSNTGERITGAAVNGIFIGADGSVPSDADTEARIDIMMKARWVVENYTLPTDSMEEKRLKIFNWVLGFPYKQHRKLSAIHKTTENLDVLFANDIFVSGSGDCVSESAALALMFSEIGYNEVYFCHDSAHSWVSIDGHIYDPLFAEARDFDANYNAIPTDYRVNPPYKMLIP